jgi:hypothetical protein
MKIEYVPRAMADKFAGEYAGNKKGFSAREISDYFCRYSNLVKNLDYYGFTPKRSDLFIESLYSLEPKQQYYALNDLTFFEYDSRYAYPDEPTRIALREELHSFLSPNAIGLSFSRIRETAYRFDWIEAYRRIATDPPGAITAARTLLETTLKTIIEERGEVPDFSGNLSRLLRQVERVLSFQLANHKGEHQIFTGMTSVVNGLASLSNIAGDRHGTIGGIAIEDPSIAELCVNFCGSMGIFFIELHLFMEIKNNSM